jgi:hypothetical protein
MGVQAIGIGYSIPGRSIWNRMPWGEAEMHSFSYTNDQVLYNQFSPYFLCRVSWLPIITNLGSLSQIRLNEYQLKSISFNYNICGIWKIFNNSRQRKYGLNQTISPSVLGKTRVFYCPQSLTSSNRTLWSFPIPRGKYFHLLPYSH